MMKIAILLEPTWGNESQKIKNFFQTHLAQYSLSFIPFQSAAAALKNEPTSLFINPYGAYFPESLWPDFPKLLEQGLAWINLGGPPLRRPLQFNGGTWSNSATQNAYHRELGFYHFPLVSGKLLLENRTNPHYPEMNHATEALPLNDVFEMYVTLVNEADRTKLDAFTNPTGDVQPLITAYGAGDRPLAAAVVKWDHYWGRFAGSRWILVNSVLDATCWEIPAFGKLVQRLTELALERPWFVKARPLMASYLPEERPTMRFYFHGTRLETIQGHLHYEIVKSGTRVHVGSTEVVCPTTSTELQTPIPIDLAPGFYRLLASFTSKQAQMVQFQSGFWCFDKNLLQQGSPIRAGQEWLTWNGKPFPVFGTSYMASDVHRWFFIDPNPAVWEDDFARMKRAGINLVRTGIWFGHELLMPTYGVANEMYLRAFDAFILSAIKYQMPVIFTMMAFSPGLGCGTSPWFDPASIRWQQEYIAQFVRRWRDCPWIIWDVINEPTMSNPKRLWTCRPQYNPFEHQAWTCWLEQRHGTIEQLRNHWDLTRADLPNFASAPLPAEMDFVDQEWTLDDIKQQKAIDYVWFTQDAFRNWTKNHYADIRAGGAPQLITIGQDEGGVETRPNPSQHADVVDFTCMHSWLLNDDVLWSIVLSRTLNKPHVFGETGAFAQDDPNKEVRRNEDYFFRLYERKFIYTFAGRAAGSIHWIWNTAATNSGEKEAAIGSLRTTGTEKAETIPLRLIANFLNLSQGWFSEGEPDSVCLLTPYTNIFAPRHPALLATQTAVRALYMHLKIAAYACSELHPENLGAPRLIIIPSPRTLTQPAWEAVLQKVAQGASLLVSGPIDYNEYWKRQERLAVLGITTEPETAPLQREENFTLNQQTWRAQFIHTKQDHYDKAVIETSSTQTFAQVSYGQGQVIYATLPLELADNLEPLLALYRYALQQAGIECPITGGSDPAFLIRPIYMEKVIFYTIVSELTENRRIQFQDRASGARIELELDRGRGALLLLDRTSGELISAYVHSYLKVNEFELRTTGDVVMAQLGKPECSILVGDGIGQVEMLNPPAGDWTKSPFCQVSRSKVTVSVPINLRYQVIKLNQQ